MIEIGKTKKGQDFLKSRRFFLLQNSPNLLFVHLNTIFCDVVFKEIDFRHVPFALLRRQGQLVLF